MIKLCLLLFTPIVVLMGLFSLTLFLFSIFENDSFFKIAMVLISFLIATTALFLFVKTSFYQNLILKHGEKVEGNW